MTAPTDKLVTSNMHVWPRAEMVRLFERTGIRTCVHGRPLIEPCLECEENCWRRAHEDADPHPEYDSQNMWDEESDDE